MKIFLDTADIEKIRYLNEFGIVDGVTTNPSIIAKSGKDFRSTIAEICSIINGSVSAEVISLSYEEMIKEAMDLIKIAKNVCIKLPTTMDGIKACNTLSSQGINVNMTLCFSAQQAIIVAKAGATFVSPFIGRLDDIGQDGLALIAEIREIYNNYGFETQILAASVRHTMHVVNCAKIGADVMTGPLSSITGLLKHPLTDIGIAQFIADYEKGNK